MIAIDCTQRTESRHSTLAQPINSAGPWCVCMEAVFLVQPWVQARTAMDCCKLCFQERDDKSHLACKRAHLSAYNALLAVVRLEKGPPFEETCKRLEQAREACISTVKPNEQCHGKSQEALKDTVDIYDKILEDYKKRLPSRQSSTPRM